MNNHYELINISENIDTCESYIVFDLHNKNYAINVKNILEIINMPEVEIPMMFPESIIGIFNYNGQMIKVVDVCPLLGLETPHFSVSNQLIVVMAEDTCFAIHTHKIKNIEQLDSTNIQALPCGSSSSIIKEVCKLDETSINIIDVAKLNEIIEQNKDKTGNINYSDLFPQDTKSKQILKIRAEQNKKSYETFSFPLDTNEINKYILFTLDNNNYYLDLKYVKEFVSVKRLNITKLPYTEDFIKGIINLKGKFLVVVDLKKFINNDSNTLEEGSKIIVVGNEDFNLAFLVDEIKYIKDLKNISKSVLHTANSKYIYAEFMEDNELYSIINFKKIINDEKIYINIG